MQANRIGIQKRDKVNKVGEKLASASRMLEVCVEQAANTGKAKAFNRCIRVLLMHDALVSGVLHSRRGTHGAPSDWEAGTFSPHKALQQYLHLDDSRFFFFLFLF